MKMVYKFISLFELIIDMHELTLPVGPQHPALAEPFHLKFLVEGEKIKGVKLRLGYAHKGIEKELEKRDWVKATYLSERTCGICGNFHTTVYCQGVEKLAGIEIPKRAEYIRTIMCELERIHSHLFWFGMCAHEMGFDTLFMYAFRDREIVMEILEKIAGNRVHYCMNLPGGVRRDIKENLVPDILKGLDRLRERANYYLNVVKKDSVIRKRCKGVGVLEKKDAEKYCVVGPTCRASGVEYDIREADPYAGYKYIEFNMITSKDRDVLARILVRLQELVECCNLIEQALDLPETNLKVNIPKKIPSGEAVSHVEAPRGELFYYLKSNGTEFPERIKMRTPTYANWSAIEPMLLNHNIADIPVVVGSIDPCLSCTDRVTIVNLNTHEEKIVTKEQLWK